MSSSDATYDSGIHIDGPVFFMGDLHGNPDALFTAAEQIDACREPSSGMKQSPCNLIILGDVGLGFDTCTLFLQEAFTELREEGWNIYLVRGNHDNPLYWTEGIEGATVLPDNKIVTINGQRVFVSGGGTSIDRSKRVLNRSYWEKEELFVPKHIPREVGRVYAVLSHTGPEPPMIHNKFLIDDWLAADRGLGADLELERIQVDRLASMRPKLWFYGHFHVNCLHEVNGIVCRALGEHVLFDATPLFPYETNTTEEHHHVAPADDNSQFEAEWSYEKKGTTFQERVPRPKGCVDVFIPFMGLYESLDDLVENQAFHSEIELWEEKEQKIKKLIGKFDLAGLMRDYVHEVARLLDLKTLEFAYLTYPREYNFHTNDLCCTISRDELWKLYEQRDKEMYDALVTDACTERPGYMPYPSTTPDRFEFADPRDFPADTPEFLEFIMDTAVAAQDSQYYVDGQRNAYAFWMANIDPHFVNERLDIEVEEA